DLAPWNAVMEWVDLLPINVIVGLLEKHFFPKWLQVLASWLNHCPNYNEVSKWYEGWKSIVYPEILAHSQVKHHFVLALDMMNRAVGMPPSGPAYHAAASTSQSHSSALPSSGRSHGLPGSCG
ncbi:Tuftelin interacting protein like, partial [Caligus rogercresseyi]